jgi:hypothetical protein
MTDTDKKLETFSEWLLRHPCRDGRCEKGKRITTGEEWTDSPCSKKPCDVHLKWINEMPGKGVSIFSQES